MVTSLSSVAYTLVYLENSYDTWHAEASEDETILARMYTQIHRHLLNMEAGKGMA